MFLEEARHDNVNAQRIIDCCCEFGIGEGRIYNYSSAIDCHIEAARYDNTIVKLFELKGIKADNYTVVQSTRHIRNRHSH